MTTKDSLISYLAALKTVRDAGEREGVSLERQADCPQPSELLLVRGGKASPALIQLVKDHVKECDYCRVVVGQ